LQNGYGNNNLAGKVNFSEVNAAYDRATVRCEWAFLNCMVNVKCIYCACVWVC